MGIKLEFKSGDILQESAEALVNTVNCVGVMGRGIALQFKKTYPDNFKAYASACKHNEVQPGKMFVFDRQSLTKPRYIINFPTKRHWRGKSRIEDIQSGLADLTDVVGKLAISSIAIPPLGSGLGGLDWNDVRPLIEAAATRIPDVQVFVYEPGGAPAADRMAKESLIPAMTAGRAALVGLMREYLSGIMGPYVTLLEVQKLMYFLQEAGENLRLNFTKALYGPYADNLRHVLNAIEGYYVSGYADGGDNPMKQLNIVPGAENEAERFLLSHPETKARFIKVAELVDGFESAFGLELLATVHWVVKNESPESSEDLTVKVHAWNERKKQFSPHQIAIAHHALSCNGWL